MRSRPKTKRGKAAKWRIIKGACRSDAYTVREMLTIWWHNPVLFKLMWPEPITYEQAKEGLTRTLKGRRARDRILRQLHLKWYGTFWTAMTTEKASDGRTLEAPYGVR